MLPFLHYFLTSEPRLHGSFSKDVEIRLFCFQIFKVSRCDILKYLTHLDYARHQNDMVLEKFSNISSQNTLAEVMT